MKKLLTCCAILGLVVLASCSGDSPKPNPLPTPAPDTWGVTLEATDNNPFVNAAVTLVASATKNGSPAPDGTTVEFRESGQLLGDVATADGVAAVSVSKDAEGSFSYTARVVDAEALVIVVWTERNPSDVLQIFLPLSPDIGDRDGGEQVILTGKGISAPVEVYFRVAGVDYQAVTMNVQESFPLPSNDGSITIETPPIINIQNSQLTESVIADSVEVRVGVGTDNAQGATYPQAFTFLPEFDELGTPDPPEIYILTPAYGSARGGEMVTILGRNFGLSLNAEDRVIVVPTNSVEVEFGGLLGIDPVVSSDGHQIQVMTPQFQATPLPEDELVDVMVTNILLNPQVFENTDTKGSAFVFLADEPTPEITAVAPSAGPVDGGTVVTIFGHGFQFPLQVFFETGGNSLEAIVNEVDDDTTLADEDQIICVSPDFSQQGLTPPFTVDVRVLNVETGKEDTAAGVYTYGDSLTIIGNSPSEGQLGDLVTIYGTGFEDPLDVDFLGVAPPLRLEDPAISGTQIIVRFPEDQEPTCTDFNGAFRVTLIERPPATGVGIAEGGAFTLIGNTPTVISVDPPIVQETLGGDGVSPSQVTIHGVRFADELLVRIDGFTLAQGDILVVDDTEITINQLPAPNDFGLVFDSSMCVTPGGLPGTREVATPVDVTVTNIPENCANTLVGGLVYEPEFSDCVAAPTVSFTLNGSFPDTDFGACSPPETLTINNTGGGDLVMTSLNLFGPFYFNGTGTQQSLPGFTVPAFSFDTSVQVYYCPQDGPRIDLTPTSLTLDTTTTNLPVALDNLAPQDTGQLTIQSNNATSPDLFSLTGNVLLTWSADITGINATEFTSNPPVPVNGQLPPVGTQPFTITFSGGGGPGVYTAQFRVTHDDPTMASPAIVQLTGNNP